MSMSSDNTKKIHSILSKLESENENELKISEEMKIKLAKNNKLIQKYEKWYMDVITLFGSHFKSIEKNIYDFWVDPENKPFFFLQ